MQFVQYWNFASTEKSGGTKTINHRVQCLDQISQLKPFEFDGFWNRAAEVTFLDSKINRCKKKNTFNGKSTEKPYRKGDGSGMLQATNTVFVNTKLSRIYDCGHIFIQIGLAVIWIVTFRKWRRCIHEHGFVVLFNAASFIKYLIKIIHYQNSPDNLNKHLKQPKKKKKSVKSKKVVMLLISKNKKLIFVWAS